MTAHAADTLARLRRGDLAGARVLDLSGAGLTTFPDEVLGLADTLEVLDLGGNAIDELPHVFARLGRLRVLFGSRNPFRVLPEVLGACAALSQIGFRGCRIEAVPDAALPAGLRWLTLTDNRIASLPDRIGDLAALRKLLLAANALRTLPEAFGALSGLELLRIGANRFETLPPCLPLLPRLAWLGFGGNPAEGAAPSLSVLPAAPCSSVTVGARRGEGASGIVHDAIWNRDGRSDAVALKLLRGRVTSDGWSAREIDAALAVGDHPALLGGLACMPDHPSGLPAVLLPLVPDTWRVLAAPPDADTCTRDVYGRDFRIPVAAACRIARTAAAAGAHLAGLGLLHGDLYAHNLLWDGTDGDARLGDLGAASRLPDGPANARLARTDVLAWGHLAAELVAVADGTDAPLEQAAILARDPDPSARPSFPDLLHLLERRDGC